MEMKYKIKAEEFDELFEVLDKKHEERQEYIENFIQKIAKYSRGITID